MLLLREPYLAGCAHHANTVLSEIQWGIRMVGFLIHIPWVLTMLEPIETGYNI
jgi:hypothetical protein